MDDDGGATPHYTRHAHDLEYSTSEDDEAAARSTIPHDMMMAPGSDHHAHEGHPSTTLLGAIESGDPRSVWRVLSPLAPRERALELTTECAGTSGPGSASPRVMIPIFHAARSGNVDVFLAVHRAARANLPRDMVMRMITSSRDVGGRDLFFTALHAGAAQVVGALGDLYDDYNVPAAKRVEILLAASERGRTAWMVAAQSGKAEVVEALPKIVGEDWGPGNEQEAEMVAAKDSRGWTALSYAVASGRTAAVEAIVALVERTVPADKVVPTLDHALPVATSEVLASTDQGRQAGALDVIAYLLSHGVWPTPKQINAVSGAGGFEASRKCFLDAMCSAVNPLLVGMILSLRLAEASELAKEGQRQVVSRLQNEVEELLMEVFERLPNTVDGFQDDDIDHTGMDACSIVFAPEKMSQDKEHPYRFSDDRGSDNRVKIGPLAIALLDRHQLELFCTQPLVLDFMFRKFTCGFPSLDAADAKMQEAQEVQRALQPSLLSVQEGADHLPSREASAGGVFALLSGTHPTFGSLTFLPGAQFIITQLVTRPGFCYSVPAVRMGMYLIVYLAMIALFGTKVLMYSGALGAGEVVFFIYVMGAILIELMAVYDDRAEYMKDHWNVLDVLAFVFCGSAFIVRVLYPDSLWGRALYAAGAPLLLFRILFFAQFLPAQGPMIEIIFSLAGELARFGTIMLVVVMGFAMSFYALFRHSCTVGAFRTYSETSINLLRAMLGETRLFDDFTVTVECCDDSVFPSDEIHCGDFLMECCHEIESEHFNGVVGKFVLVAYLTLMGIILLNLLIAVLSEAYVDVKENIDKEAKVSRTLVIQHYVEAVEDDMLPSPLNLVQYVVSLLAMVVGLCLGRKGYFRKAEYFSGLVLFWFVSGVFAVSAGSVLWAISWPKAVVIFFRRGTAIRVSKTPVTTQVAVLLCGVTMPLYLVYKWLWASTGGALWRRVASAWSLTGTEYNEIGGSSQHDDGIVGKALKLGQGAANRGNALNVQQLREYLANPMNDPVVQRDEETRETTVEHIKLLRDHVDNMVGERISELDSATGVRFRGLKAGLERDVRSIVDDRVCALSEKISRVDEKMSAILRGMKGKEYAGTLIPAGAGRRKRTTGGRK